MTTTKPIKRRAVLYVAMGNKYAHALNTDFLIVFSFRCACLVIAGYGRGEKSMWLYNRTSLCFF